jgi:hypothetical protein
MFPANLLEVYEDANFWQQSTKLNQPVSGLGRVSRPGLYHRKQQPQKALFDAFG